jgi:sugar (pentulose or hexulose) kinase
MADKTILSIDFGTQSVRAIIFDRKAPFGQRED